MQAIKNSSLLSKDSLLGCLPWTAWLHMLHWDWVRYEQRLQKPNISLPMLGFPDPHNSSWETQSRYYMCTYNLFEEYVHYIILDLTKYISNSLFKYLWNQASCTALYVSSAKFHYSPCLYLSVLQSSLVNITFNNLEGLFVCLFWCYCCCWFVFLTLSTASE